MNKFRSLLVASAALLTFGGSVYGIELDSGFSNGYDVVYITGQQSYATAVTRQADGKIVVGGVTEQTFPDYAVILARYTTDGVLDGDFGNGGIGTVAKDITDRDEVGSVAMNIDGRILVGFLGEDNMGSPRNMFAIFSVAGVLDESMGDFGAVTVPGSDINFGELVSLVDGGFLVCGHITSPDDRAYVAKFTSAGDADTNFGVNGISLVDLDYVHDEFRDMLVLSDGDILAGGITEELNTKIAIVKMSPTGTLDGSFGTGGIFTYDVEPSDSFGSMIELPDGDILVLVDKVGDAAAIFRVQSTGGGLDAAFGDNGVLDIDRDARDLLLLSNGKIMITGQSPSGTVFFRVYNEDSSLELTFGNNGTQDMSSMPDSWGSRLLLQDDGKVVTIGAISESDSLPYGVLTMRLNDPDPDLDGVMDTDNCPNDANSDQSDEDSDDIGDVCDPGPDPILNNDNNSGGSGSSGGGGGGSAGWHLIGLLAMLIARKSGGLREAVRFQIRTKDGLRSSRLGSE